MFKFSFQTIFRITVRLISILLFEISFKTIFRIIYRFSLIILFKIGFQIIYRISCRFILIRLFKLRFGSQIKRKLPHEAKGVIRAIETYKNIKVIETYGNIKIIKSYANIKVLETYESMNFVLDNDLYKNLKTHVEPPTIQWDSSILNKPSWIIVVPVRGSKWCDLLLVMMRVSFLCGFLRRGLVWCDLFSKYATAARPSSVATCCGTTYRC